MKRLPLIAIWSLIAWIVFGSLTLIYFQSIDGVVINKPATFLVDIQNFKTDKEVYARGDMVYIFSSFCRNRSFTAKTTWRLINETVITFPETESKVAPAGCVKDKWFPIGAIPLFATPGTHRLEGVSALQINALKTIYLDFKSQPFLVK